MLYNLEWLQPGKAFPPLVEQPRIQRYLQNEMLFDGEHFNSGVFRNRNGVTAHTVGLYNQCCARIAKVVGNFEDVISILVLMNYQRFITLKTADLVAGERPTITGATDAENDKIKWIRENTNFDAVLYSMVIDMSRFGDVPIRIYKDEFTNYYTYTIWDCTGWYPVVMQDGTNRISHQVLCWMYNEQPDIDKQDDWYLHVQVYDTQKPGEYEYRVYHNGGNRNVIGPLVSSPATFQTGLNKCPVMNIRAFETSNTVYGYDDYMPIDSVLAEIIERVSQISAILDKHADPSMVGPPTLLDFNQATGEWLFKTRKFYQINGEDQKPEYLVWDGQLEAAFRQLEFLVNQLYILSEMGAAITGGNTESASAVSGTALRFKMVNPLAKARRITNSLDAPIKRLFSLIGSNLPDIDSETGEPGSGKDTPLPFGHISIQWEDGLPDDPSEQISNCKLATGENTMIPLEDGLMTYFKKSPAEAARLVEKVRAQAKENKGTEGATDGNGGDGNAGVNHPGPQDGTGVNPQKKNSKMGVSSFQAENNKSSENK